MEAYLRLIAGHYFCHAPFFQWSCSDLKKVKEMRREHFNAKLIKKFGTFVVHTSCLTYASLEKEKVCLSECQKYLEE
jgi:hypothetical protein